MVNELLKKRKNVIFIGETDTGKTSLVRSALEELRRIGARPAHVDLDMGQSTIGPPATIGLRDSTGREYLCFVGNTSPYGVTAEIMTALGRIGPLLERLQPDRTIVDTAGLVRDGFGWFLARTELAALKPDLVVILGRAGESSHIARGVRKMGIDCVELVPSPAVRIRGPDERSRYRSKLFLEYFRNARIRRLPTGYGDPSQTGMSIQAGQIAGLIDRRGFLVCLGVFRGVEKDLFSLLVPKCTFRKIRSVRFGRYVRE
jgi:polynucleotide 5'-hydroxyl-kinase GRC3/NOL9